MKSFPTSERFNLVAELAALRGTSPTAEGCFKLAHLFYDRGLVLKENKELSKSFRHRRLSIKRGVLYDDLKTEIAFQEEDYFSGMIAPYIAWGEFDGKFMAVQVMLDTSCDLDEGDAEIFTDWVDVSQGFNSGYNNDGEALAYDWGFEFENDPPFFEKQGENFVQIDFGEAEDNEESTYDSHESNSCNYYRS